MKFAEVYEPICRLTDGNAVSLGTFRTYEEANDAALMQACAKLPEECVAAYQIVKSYVNVPVFTSQQASNGGIS